MSYPFAACIISFIFFVTLVVHLTTPEEERTSNWFLIGLRWLIYIAFIAGLSSVLFFDGDVETFVWVSLFAFGGSIFVILKGIAGAAGAVGGGNNRSSNSYGSDSVEYVPQRLGGSGWLNIGNSFYNLNSAIASVESSRRFHPNDRFRVAEKRNGRIVGTAYSC